MKIYNDFCLSHGSPISNFLKIIPPSVRFQVFFNFIYFLYNFTIIFAFTWLFLSLRINFVTLYANISFTSLFCSSYYYMLYYRFINIMHQLAQNLLQY